MSNSGEHFIIKYTTKKLIYEMLNPALKRQKTSKRIDERKWIQYLGHATLRPPHTALVTQNCVEII